MASLLGSAAGSSRRLARSAALMRWRVAIVVVIVRLRSLLVRRFIKVCCFVLMNSEECGIGCVLSMLVQVEVVS
jgi:hypothetical protein